MAGGVNALTVEELRKALADLNLETRGHKPELKKRLRTALKQLPVAKDDTNDDANPTADNATIDDKPNESSPLETDPDTTTTQPEEEPSTATPTTTIPRQPLDYYLFFDVEATCVADAGFEYPNEIIEFPVVLVSGETFEIVDEFQSYVKPTIDPVLSDFCKKLTGIQQETIDQSPDFVQVLNQFQEFMAKYSLFIDKTAAFVTDGPFDIRDFITKQCVHSRLKKRPSYFEQPWVNIRKLYRDFYKHKENKNISAMLSGLGMTFDGHEHSGLDDARNLVRIAQRMVADGCIFKTNMYWGDRMTKQHARNKKRLGKKRR